MGPCLGTQFKWKIFARFCGRFLTANETMPSCGETPGRAMARGPRAGSLGSTVEREWPLKSTSESDCRRPSGTVRPNPKPPFEAPTRHAASSIISWSSFFRAAFAQPCHLGIPTALPSTYTSWGVIGSPPSGGIKAQCGRIVLYRRRNSARHCRA